MTATKQSLDGTHPAWRALVDAGFAVSRIDDALAHYDEPHRVYHDRRHVQEMVEASERLRVSLSPAQALALLFHDAVYVPGAARAANEALSAQLLRVYARGIDEWIVSQACSIVLDTAEHVPSSAAAAVVLDLDLLRLAAPAAEFELHSRALFSEQRPLLRIDGDDAAWRYFSMRRGPFFERLLSHRSIFVLPLFIERFEAAARRNLNEAVGLIKRPDSRETT